MKPAHSHLTQFRLAVLAAGLLAASAAHAWTVEGKSKDDGNMFIDPDVKVEQFNNGNVPTQPGGTSFRFNVGPSNSLFGRPYDNGLGAAGQFIPLPGQTPERR
ncbi:MAG TPA: hypothetical protein VKT73_10200 [Xanthobacteraceae bacterium]|nr:hypothetical protein [Xanthobacteraceae bacterium]